MSLSVSISLEELAKRANAEHAKTAAALSKALGHALAAGEILTEAKDRTQGSWRTWCEEHLEFHHTTANWYIRMFKYRDELAAADVTSFKKAMTFLREEELGRNTTTVQRQEIMSMLHEGVPQVEIGRRVGLSKGAINHYAKRRNGGRGTARWITHRRPRSGGRWDKAYGYFRQSLGQVAELAPNADPKYDELYEHLHWIEDFFGRRLRTGR